MPSIDVYWENKGYRIVLPNETINENIREEGSNHNDGSGHDFEPSFNATTLIGKCIICGVERSSNKLCKYAHLN